MRGRWTVAVYIRMRVVKKYTAFPSRKSAEDFRRNLEFFLLSGTKFSVEVRVYET